MILTVDIGNSRIKVASWQACKIVARGVDAYDASNIVQSFDTLFSVVEKPENIYAACVAEDAVKQALSDWCLQHWQMQVEFLKTENSFNGITHAYENPEQHGVDRWAAVVASVQLYPDASICVIGAGTALTFDFINSNGRHLGGYILPSYVTMHVALMADTANVASSQQLTVHNDVPSNTSDAVNQGIHILLQAGIRELCKLSQDKMEAPVTFIVSGGFSKVILGYPDMPAIQHEPDLVMQGVFSIMSESKK